jgi:hypothetical protein
MTSPFRIQRAELPYWLLAFAICLAVFVGLLAAGHVVLAILWLLVWVFG